MYFSQVRVDPNDPDVVYLGGVGLHHDARRRQDRHTDVAAADPRRRARDLDRSRQLEPRDHRQRRRPRVSWDQAKTWNFLPNLPVGLFYHVSVDMATPYNVCGGMQDNYSWCGPSQVRGAAGIASFHWTTVQGGDGFVAAQDPTDFRVAYSESQDGNMVRVDRVTGESMSIRPIAAPGEPALRWHWDTPIVHVAARSEHHLRRRQQSVPLARTAG